MFAAVCSSRRIVGHGASRALLMTAAASASTLSSFSSLPPSLSLSSLSSSWPPHSRRHYARKAPAKTAMAASHTENALRGREEEERVHAPVVPRDPARATEYYFDDDPTDDGDFQAMWQGTVDNTLHIPFQDLSDRNVRHMRFYKDSDYGKLSVPAATVGNRHTLLRACLHLNRVSNATKAGKVPSIAAVVIVGNRSGSAGLGYGKGKAANDAIKAAEKDAIKNMVYIKRNENSGLYNDMFLKYNSTKVYIWGRPPGFGLHGDQKMSIIFKAFGIKDATFKSYDSRNPLNVARAYFTALTTLHQDPYEVAREKGLKYVDVRKMFLHFGPYEARNEALRQKKDMEASLRNRQRMIVRGEVPEPGPQAGSSPAIKKKD